MRANRSTSRLASRSSTKSAGGLMARQRMSAACTSSKLMLSVVMAASPSGRANRDAVPVVFDLPIAGVGQLIELDRVGDAPRHTHTQFLQQDQEVAHRSGQSTEGGDRRIVQIAVEHLVGVEVLDHQEVALQWPIPARQHSDRPRSGYWTLIPASFTIFCQRSMSARMTCLN